MINAPILPTDPRSTRVLLIEDNPEQMVLVQRSLQEFGHGHYQLECASGLSEGVELLGTADFDVVLLDLGLPECTGPASYVAVRAKAPHVPVVVLTAEDREDTVLEVIADGAEGYLVKQEASGRRLIKAIRGAMARRRTR